MLQRAGRRGAFKCGRCALARLQAANLAHALVRAVRHEKAAAPGRGPVEGETTRAQRVEARVLRGACRDDEAGTSGALPSEYHTYQLARLVC